MSTFKQQIGSLRTWIRIQISYMKDIYSFWTLTKKFNASSHTNSDIEKMKYTLLRENHTIEKGLSMRNPRKGFGQIKVARLLSRLNIYVDRYGAQDMDFLRYPLGTIKHYIQYTKKSGVCIPEIEIEYEKLIGRTKLKNIQEQGGIKKITRESIAYACNQDFSSLLLSRHSIRYFSNEEVCKDTIEKALKMAQRTPSACNRQGWKTHVYQGSRSVELIKWQGGSRGFEDEIKCSIVVTANLKAFLYHEIHQAYVDGGLYAMNLINALHSLGLGTIPLSCGFTHKKLRKLIGFGIPKNEVPVVIIGIGNLMEEFNVAISERKDIKITNTFH